MSPKAIFGLILAGSAGICLAGNVTASDSPNVLFISIDDLNDWIGCLKGHPQALTPNIDRLAARGVLFTNAHCAAPACRPSRAALFSGKLPRQTGVWSNRSKALLEQHPNAQVISRVFRATGYNTVGCGKLLHQKSAGKAVFEDYFKPEQRWSPLTSSTVRYTDGELPSKGTNDPKHLVNQSGRDPIILPLNRMPSDRKPGNPGGESFDWGAFDVADETMGDAQITDWAIEQLQQPRDKPLFLGVGYYRPHIPLWAPQRYFDRLEGTAVLLPPTHDADLDDLSDIAKQWALEPVTAGAHSTVLQYGQWREAVKAYLACVTFVDHHVGRLIDALDATQIGRSTIIVLWSDHGWHLGEKQHWGKWTGWERSTRVPLMIVPPKRQAGEYATGECDQPVSLIDLFPTLTEFCDIEAPDELDGESLVPLLRDPRRSTDRTAVTFFGRGNVTVRTKHWRYIRYADGSEELYDHETDAHEWTNLSARREYENTMRQLRKSAM